MKPTALLTLTGLGLAGALSQNNLEETAEAQLASVTYSGSATAIHTGAVSIADTGSIPSGGDALDSSADSVTVPGVLNADIASSFAIGNFDKSSAHTIVGGLDVGASGVSVRADFVGAGSQSTCGSQSGSADIENLTINGQPVAVTGAANQVVPLLNGTVTINEQFQSSGNLVVNALRIEILGSTDIVVASASSGINCPVPPTCTDDKDFITAGGHLGTRSDKRTFGTVAGARDERLQGHIQFHDHSAQVKVNSDTITVYTLTGPNSRHIEASCEVNGVPGHYCLLDEADNGPGQSDTFSLRVSNGYVTAGNLTGGNIVLHSGCTPAPSPTPEPSPSPTVSPEPSPSPSPTEDPGGGGEGPPG